MGSGKESKGKESKGKRNKGEMGSKVKGAYRRRGGSDTDSGSGENERGSFFWSDGRGADIIVSVAQGG